MTRRLGPSDLGTAATERFVAERTRHERAWRKRPSTSELLRWIEALRLEGNIRPDAVRTGPLADLLPYALVKTREDLKLLGLDG